MRHVEVTLSALPFAGWMFTLGFAKLSFWSGAAALLFWPYYLGAAVAS